MSGVDLSTIRRLTLPVGAERSFRVTKPEKELAAAPTPFNCSYKFAASVKELDYVARRVVYDDLRALELQAPPGVGKSTRFPMVLSELTNDRIFVLQPTESLAQAQVATLQAAGRSVSYLGEKSVLDFRLSKTPGVIYTTPSVFLAHMQLCSVVGHRYVNEPSRYVVVHDECHENDGATYTLRTLWPTMTRVVRYIKMSATTGGDRVEARQRHNGAHKLVVKKYAPKEENEIGPLDGEAEGRPSPWAVTSLRGRRTLMFVEDDVVAKDLHKRYGEYMPVKILRRNDPYSNYVRAQDLLASNPTMLVIVDSGYQSGYTFNVDVVIDLGIRRQTVDDGSVALGSKYRIVTASERRQRVERAARFKPGVAYVPDELPIASDSVLAPGELGHAAAWMFLFGYNVPEVLRIPAIDKIPEANIPKFFSSGMPWTYWQREYWESRPTLEIGTGASLDSKGESKAVVDSPGIATSGRAEDDALVRHINVPGVCVPAEPKVTVTQTVPGRSVERKSVVVQPAVDIYTWAKRTAENPKAQTLGRGNFLKIRGDTTPYDPTSFAETLATDGDIALRWLEREILCKTPAQLKLSTAVDGILQWSVWLAAWNHNEAANVVTTWYAVCGTPIKYSPPWPPGLRIYDTRIFDVYTAVRWLLRSYREKLLCIFPRKLDVIDGSAYIHRGLRMAQYDLAFWHRSNLAGLRQVDVMYRKMERIAADKRKRASTVGSSAVTTEESAKSSNADCERFSEVFK